MSGATNRDVTGGGVTEPTATHFEVSIDPSLNGHVLHQPRSPAPITGEKMGPHSKSSVFAADQLRILHSDMHCGMLCFCLPPCSCPYSSVLSTVISNVLCMSLALFPCPPLLAVARICFRAGPSQLFGAVKKIFKLFGWENPFRCPGNFVSVIGFSVFPHSMYSFFVPKNLSA
ncbi:hypothetical protein CRG98_024761 [Punica granatum]|uniref:Uncharacterized protein n=1 Tax=Punica granatum TaxID=22663 RepID=A0A2I0JF71_PUNGR|nr:hypothetical protein CRG98_024761 [Punica granatum]